MRDSTVTKRPAPKKRGSMVDLIPGPVREVASDIYAGFGELKRQSGTAVERIKEGVRRIKSSIAR